MEIATVFSIKFEDLKLFKILQHCNHFLLKLKIFKDILNKILDFEFENHFTFQECEQA